MNDILGKVFAIFVCVYLMFLYPLSVVKTENMRMEKTYLYQETVYFVDSVCNTGKITPQTMKEYQDKVAAMSNYYQVELSGETFILEDTGSYTSFISENEIKKCLEEGQTYLFHQNDFIRIVLKDKNHQSILYYGGSIKAVNEEETT